jgi:hypothetical protein
LIRESSCCSTTSTNHKCSQPHRWRRERGPFVNIIAIALTAAKSAVTVAAVAAAAAAAASTVCARSTRRGSKHVHSLRTL